MPWPAAAALRLRRPLDAPQDAAAQYPFGVRRMPDSARRGYRMISEGHTLDHHDAEPRTDELPMPAPRTVDAATWVARGIVVATLGLVTLVLGLIVGIMVADPGPTTASGPTAAGVSPSTSPPTSIAPPEASGTQAPPTRVSAAITNHPTVPAAPARLATGATTRSSVVAAPTSTTSTASTTTHGRSGNTGKPKPTKP